VTLAVLGGAAVAVTVKSSDSGGASSPPCRDTSRCLLTPPVFSFCLVFFFTSVSPPGFSFFSLFPFFLLLCSPLFFSFLSLSLSIALPFFCRPPFFLRSGGIYRGRGSRARGKERKRQREENKKHLFPCYMSGGRRKRNSAASKRHRFVSLFFVFF